MSSENRENVSKNLNLPAVPALPQNWVDRLTSANRASPSGDFMSDGSRNSSLTSLGGFLVRKHGLSGEVLAAQLLNINAGQPSPLASAEVLRIASSLSNYQDGLLHELDELSVSRAFETWISDSFKWTPQQGWMFYHETKWEVDYAGKHLQETCKTYIELLTEQYAVAVAQCEGVEREMLQKKAKLARGLGADAKIRKICSLVSSDPSILSDIAEFDKKPYLFNCNNGTLDLRNMSFREHSSSDLIPKMSDVVFDPDAQCPVFLRTLQEVLPEGSHRAFLMRFFGYAMAGDPIEQAFLIIHGPGRNGKSTIANAVAGAIGDYHANADPSTFCGNQQSQIRNDLARLTGRRLVTTAELPNGSLLDASLVKRLTGGEELTVRFLHKEHFQMKSEFSLVMVTNYLPVVNGNDKALHRRVLLLPFSICVPQNTLDPRLPSKLDSERSGILNMVLAGLQDYQKNGLAVPSDLSLAAEDYLKQSNLIDIFLSETMVVEVNASTKASLVYQRYRSWCETNGYKPFSNQIFKSELQKANNVTFKRRNDGNYWLGIRSHWDMPRAVEEVESQKVVSLENRIRGPNNLASTPSTVDNDGHTNDPTFR